MWCQVHTSISKHCMSVRSQSIHVLYLRVFCSSSPQSNCLKRIFISHWTTVFKELNYYKWAEDCSPLIVILQRWKCEGRRRQTGKVGWAAARFRCLVCESYVQVKRLVSLWWYFLWGVSDYAQHPQGAITLVWIINAVACVIQSSGWLVLFYNLLQIGEEGGLLLLLCFFKWEEWVKGQGLEGFCVTEVVGKKRAPLVYHVRTILKTTSPQKTSEFPHCFVWDVPQAAEWLLQTARVLCWGQSGPPPQKTHPFTILTHMPLQQ